MPRQETAEAPTEIAKICVHRANLTTLVLVMLQGIDRLRYELFGASQSMNMDDSRFVINCPGMTIGFDSCTAPLLRTLEAC